MLIKQNGDVKELLTNSGKIKCAAGGTRTKAKYGGPHGHNSTELLQPGPELCRLAHRFDCARLRERTRGKTSTHNVIFCPRAGDAWHSGEVACLDMSRGVN